MYWALSRGLHTALAGDTTEGSVYEWRRDLRGFSMHAKHPLVKARYETLLGDPAKRRARSRRRAAVVAEPSNTTAKELATKLYWRLAGKLSAAEAGNIEDGTVEDFLDEIAGHAEHSIHPELQRRYAALLAGHRRAAVAV